MFVVATMARAISAVSFGSASLHCEAARRTRQMVARDPLSAGSRGSHRYTFGTAPAHFGHAAAWAVLVDPPVTLAVLSAIFGSDDFYQARRGRRRHRVSRGPLYTCIDWCPSFPSHNPNRGRENNFTALVCTRPARPPVATSCCLAAWSTSTCMRTG